MILGNDTLIDYGSADAFIAKFGHLGDTLLSVTYKYSIDYINVYPNPTTGQFTVQGATGAYMYMTSLVAWCLLQQNPK